MTKTQFEDHPHFGKTFSDEELREICHMNTPYSAFLESAMEQAIQRKAWYSLARLVSWQGERNPERGWYMKVKMYHQTLPPFGYLGKDYHDYTHEFASNMLGVFQNIHMDTPMWRALPMYSKCAHIEYILVTGTMTSCTKTEDGWEATITVE